MFFFDGTTKSKKNISLGGTSKTKSIDKIVKFSNQIQEEKILREKQLKAQKIITKYCQMFILKHYAQNRLIEEYENSIVSFDLAKSEKSSPHEISRKISICHFLYKKTNNLPYLMNANRILLACYQNCDYYRFLFGKYIYVLHSSITQNTKYLMDLISTTNFYAESITLESMFIEGVPSIILKNIEFTVQSDSQNAPGLLFSVVKTRFIMKIMSVMAGISRITNLEGRFRIVETLAITCTLLLSYLRKNLQHNKEINDSDLIKNCFADLMCGYYEWSKHPPDTINLCLSSYFSTLAVGKFIPDNCEMVVDPIVKSVNPSRVHSWLQILHTVLCCSPSPESVFQNNTLVELQNIAKFLIYTLTGHLFLASPAKLELENVDISARIRNSPIKCFKELNAIFFQFQSFFCQVVKNTLDEISQLDEPEKLKSFCSVVPWITHIMLHFKLLPIENSLYSNFITNFLYHEDLILHLWNIFFQDGIDHVKTEYRSLLQSMSVSGQSISENAQKPLYCRKTLEALVLPLLVSELISSYIITLYLPHSAIEIHSRLLTDHIPTETFFVLLKKQQNSGLLEIFNSKESLRVVSTVLRSICDFFAHRICTSRTEIMDRDLKMNITSSWEKLNILMHNHNKSKDFVISVDFLNLLCAQSFKSVCRLLNHLYQLNDILKFEPSENWLVNSSSTSYTYLKSILLPIRYLLTEVIDGQTSQDKLLSALQERRGYFDIIKNIPHCFDFNTRFLFVYQVNYILSSRQRSMHTNISLNICRSEAFTQTFQALMQNDEYSFFSVGEISFENELGMGFKSLFRNLINLLTSVCFSSETALFVHDPSGWLVPNPNHYLTLGPDAAIGDSNKYFRFVGKILLQAIILNCLPKIPISPLVIISMIGFPGERMSLWNLRYYDLQLYKQFIFLLNSTDEELKSMCITFTANNVFGEMFELKPKGSEIIVSRENVYEYVFLHAKFLTNDQTALQYKNICDGFNHEQIGCNYQFFETNELLQMFCNFILEFNVEEMIENIEFHFSDDPNLIDIFFKAIRSFNHFELNDLFFFWTGRTQVPGEFSNLEPRLNVRCNPSPEFLPTVSVCSHTLVIPSCENERELSEKLKYSIQNHYGFALA